MKEGKKENRGGKHVSPTQRQHMGVTSGGTSALPSPLSPLSHLLDTNEVACAELLHKRPRLRVQIKPYWVPLPLPLDVGEEVRHVVPRDLHPPDAEGRGAVVPFHHFARDRGEALPLCAVCVRDCVLFRGERGGGGGGRVSEKRR